MLGLGLLLLLLLLRLRLPGTVGQGAGRGVPLTVYMTGSNPERVNVANLVQPRRVKIYINILQSSRRAKMIFMWGVIPKVRYPFNQVQGYMNRLYR